MSEYPIPEDRCKCGQPHDGWPGSDGRELCQMCWEAECSESWWQAVIAIDKARAAIAQAKEQG